MVILMKNDKTLVKTVNSRLYQKENVVDSLVFYIPETYEDMDLSSFTATLYYTTQTNDAYMEVLEQVESDKEGYLMYRLPVTTKLTASAGNVTLEISLIMNDEESDTKHVLHTSELTIMVETWQDYYKYVPNDSLAAIDNRILELDAKADKLKSISETIEKETPNDLKLTEDKLQLMRKDEETGEIEVFGEGVEILVPGDPDDEDEDHDGVIDIDQLPDNADTSILSSSGYQFVEL